MIYSDLRSPATSRPRHSSPRIDSPNSGPVNISNPSDLAKKAALLEKRDRKLVEMLSDALAELRTVKESVGLDSNADEALNRAYETVQSVQINLDSSSTPMPTESTKGLESTDDQKDVSPQGNMRQERQDVEAPLADSHDTRMTAAPSSMVGGSPNREDGVTASSKPLTATPVPHRTAARSTLAQSEFSWMLGDKMNRSSFVSSASLPPDQSRHGDARTKQGPLFGDSRDEGRKHSTEEDDGLALNSLRGGSG